MTGSSERANIYKEKRGGGSTRGRGKGRKKFNDLDDGRKISPKKERRAVLVLNPEKLEYWCRGEKKGVQSKKNMLPGWALRKP